MGKYLSYNTEWRTRLYNFTYNIINMCVCARVRGYA